MTRAFICVGLLFGLFMAGSVSRAADEPVRVAAASSLQFMLNEIISRYSEQTANATPQVVYGSSGNLYRQILQGAPFDLFLSADSSLIEQLDAAQRAKAPPLEIGSDQLVLYTTKAPAPDVNALRERLERKEANAFKVAIANPRHAPFGRAAQQALESLNLWQQMLPNLVFAEKVSQAAQFAVSGATEFAVISHTLAVSPVLKKAGRFSVISPTQYQPVVQAMVLLSDDNASQALFDFIGQSNAAASVFQKFGLR